MNRKNRKFLVLILTIAMIFSGIGTAFATDDTAGSVTNAYQEFGPMGSSWWSFDVSGSTFNSDDAICAASLNMSIPLTGQSVAMQKLSITDERTKLAYYAYSGHNQTMEDRWYLHECASKLSGNGTASTNPGIDAYYEEAMKVTVPANFEAYYCDPTNGSQAFLAWNMAPMGKINLKKVSANPAISDKSSCYSLENAEYGVYKTKGDAEKDTNKVASLTTNAKGESNTIEIAPGTYFVKERKASKGYALDKNIYLVTVQNGKTVAVNGGQVKEVPQNDPVNIIVGKIDKETTKEMAQGGATFEGAEFEVIYQDAKPQPRVWRFKTNAKGRAFLYDKAAFVSGDELYYDMAGKNVVFPLGKYTIQEKVAPKGYNVDDTVYTVEVTGNHSNTETVETYNAPTIKEQVKRYNLDFIKVEDGTQKRMANVPFLLTCVETGESHVIVTDENGQFNTQMADFMANTNKNDEAYDPKTGKVDDSKLSPEYGLWFGQDADGNTSKAYADAKGNIVYGTYTLTELSSKANKGHKLLKDIEIKFNKSKDGYEVRMGTLTNDWSNNQPKIGTTLTDEGNNKLVAAAPNTKLVDKVAYSGFEVGKEYVFEGTLIVKSTGKPLTQNGKEVVVRSEKFVAKQASGTADVPFVIDTTKLDGQEIVAYETAYEITASGEDVVAEHKDINDEGQTVRVTTNPVPTGDMSNWQIFAVILIVALAGLGGLLAFRRRRVVKDAE